MVKKLIKETLADKIAGVLNTTPSSFDPEDDNVDDTRAKIEEYSEEPENEDVLLSTFKKQNIELLADIDKRYAGKKASRKKLHSSDEDEDISEDDDQYEQESSGDSEGGSDESETGEESGEDVDSFAEDEEADSEESDKDITSDNFADEIVKNDDSNFKHFKEEDRSLQVKKGLSVRNQMRTWENLLEIRIQLQKCLIAANKMPQKESYVEIKKESGQEFSDQVATTKNSLVNLLDKLLVLQKLTLSKYPETKRLNKGHVEEKEEDEEIPSDTEEEMSAGEEEEQSEVPKKKRKLTDFETVINERHNIYKNYRNKVIQKWNDKTRVVTMKSSNNSHSVLNHIEHTLSDKSKLVKRTRLKRSNYTILGQQSSIENESNEGNPSGVPTDEYNTEIFDDDDFYHQLLRELIEFKSADLTDPIQLGRQWIQLQKLRSKMKRKIDTKATKGRKIRYTVHAKLVNFMAPIDENLWTDQAKTELYNSLFGKKEY